MERLDRYLPDIADAETEVVELALDASGSRRPVALVEYHFDEEDGDGDEVVLEARDLDERKVVARMVVDLGGDLEAGVGEVRRDRSADGRLSSALVCGVVQGLIDESDYIVRLRDHRRQFREAVRAHRDAEGPSPEAFEEAGRNEPCPCGSGRKYKKCCLGDRRERMDQPRRHDLSLDEFGRTWRRRARALEEQNQLLEEFWSVLDGAGQGVERALRFLDDIDIDVDREYVIEAAGAMDGVEDFPDQWRRDQAADRGWKKPLMEVVLPVLAEFLWHHWIPETPRPHRVKRCIVAGYDAASSREQTVDWWSEAWSGLQAWIEPRLDRRNPDELIATLDDALLLADGVEQWVVDLLEVARSSVGSDLEEPSTQRLLVVLAGIGEVFAESAPSLANDADVFRYAALLDAGEVEAAGSVLEDLSQKPLADRHTAQYLCDLFVEWDYRAPGGHLEIVDDIAARTLREFEVESPAMLESSRRRLSELAGE